jgi:hypothetical protein
MITVEKPSHPKPPMCTRPTSEITKNGHAVTTARFLLQHMLENEPLNEGVRPGLRGMKEHVEMAGATTSLELV